MVYVKVYSDIVDIELQGVPDGLFVKTVVAAELDGKAPVGLEFRHFAVVI